MRRIRAFLMAAAVLGTSALAITPAYAGSNGQQINFCVSSGAVTNGFATANGVNQDGIDTSSPPMHLGGVGQCTGLSNWWWKGQVTITWSNGTGNYVETTTCNVPPWQGSDWTVCSS